MFGFSWGVIAVAVVIIAAVSVIFDIEWYKVALVVAAILFVSVLYRDGKLPDFLEPIASKVFFWVDKGAEETKESKETKELQETKETKKADKSLFSRIKEMGRSQLAKRIFGVRIITLIIIGCITWGLHVYFDWELGKVTVVAIALFVVVVLYTRDKLPESVEPVVGRVFQHENNIDIEDTYRPMYDVGTCRDLSGTPYVLSIYIDDDESSWTVEEAENFQNSVVVPGLEFVNEQAALWGVSLDLGSGMYVTDSSKDISIQYDGTILTLLNGEATPREEILKQAARSMGFLSTKSFYQHLQELTGEQQVAILLFVNKDGRSHAQNDFKADDGEEIECCVIYSSQNSNSTRFGTISHELLHSFGAEDLYEEKSTGERAGRAAIAEQYYPNDIMLHNGSEVGAYTAYAVGWTHELPEECVVSEFWEGHWSRED